jgi:hypothetical protein
LHQGGDLHLRLGVGHGGSGGGLQLRGGLIDVGLGRRPGIDGVLPAAIPFGLGLVGLRLPEVRRKADAGNVQIDLCAGKLCPGQRKVGLGLFAGGGVVARVDRQQRVAGMEKYIVIDVEPGDIAGHLGGIGDGVPLGVGTVSAFQVAGEQPVSHPRDDRDHDDDGKNDQRPRVLELPLS